MATDLEKTRVNGRLVGRVWLVRWGHRHGTDVGAYDSEEAAWEIGVRGILLDYGRERLMDDRDDPSAWARVEELVLSGDIVGAAEAYGEAADEYIEVGLPTEVLGLPA
jgi:hypothetical protein